MRHAGRRGPFAQRRRRAARSATARVRTSEVAVWTWRAASRRRTSPRGSSSPRGRAWAEAASRTRRSSTHDEEGSRRRARFRRYGVASGRRSPRGAPPPSVVAGSSRRGCARDRRRTRSRSGPLDANVGRRSTHDRALGRRSDPETSRRRAALDSNRTKDAPPSASPRRSSPVAFAAVRPTTPVNRPTTSGKGTPARGDRAGSFEIPTARGAEGSGRLSAARHVHPTRGEATRSPVRPRGSGGS